MQRFILWRPKARVYDAILWGGGVATHDYHVLGGGTLSTVRIVSGASSVTARPSGRGSSYVPTHGTIGV